MPEIPVAPVPDPMPRPNPSRGCVHAFARAGAVQCGYCTPGMVLATKALLDEHPHPTREQILEALEGNLCRCTGYTKILDAVEDAAETLSREVAAK